MATSISSPGAAPPVQPQQLATLSEGLSQIKDVLDSAAKALAEQAAAQGVDTAALEQTLRAMGALPAGMLAPAGPLLDDFGATPVSLPEVAAASDMGSLSTADLLQLLRDQSRKTTELLMAATMEAIKNMQANIEVNSDSSIAKLMEAAKAQGKAEDLQKLLKVVKWAAVGAAVIIGAAAMVGTGGAATPLVLAAVSLALTIGTTVLSQVKDESGVSVMDKAMKGLAKGMQKASEAFNELPDWAQWVGVGVTAAAAVGLAFLDPKSLSVTLPILAAMTVSALPDKLMSEEQKGQVMASILMIGVMVAASVYAAGAATSAAPAGASALGASAGSVARMVGSVGNLLQGLMQMAQGGMQMATALNQYNADRAQADVMALQELVKMMQTLLDGDSSFIQTLADIQAQLDAGVAQIVALEHQTNENANTEAYS